MPQGMRILLPIFTVEQLHRDFIKFRLIQTTQIDAVSIRIRPWNIKRFNATGFTKQMLGFMGVESIRGEVIFPLQ
jgi:hypothetical protein